MSQGFLGATGAAVGDVDDALEVVDDTSPRNVVPSLRCFLRIWLRFWVLFGFLHYLEFISLFAFVLFVFLARLLGFCLFYMY